MTAERKAGHAESSSPSRVACAVSGLLAVTLGVTFLFSSLHMLRSVRAVR